MIPLLVTLFVLTLVASLIWYIVAYLLPVPQPFKNVLLAILCVIFIIYLLAMISGNAPVLTIRG